MRKIYLSIALMLILLASTSAVIVLPVSAQPTLQLFASVSIPDPNSSETGLAVMLLADESGTVIKVPVSIWSRWRISWLVTP